MSTDHQSPEWIGEQSWTNPFPEGHPLHDLFGKRIRQKQDLIIIIDDYWSRRGTGKTITSLQIAEGMDQNGGLTEENCSLDPQELRNAYSNLPKRSALVLDEGEVGVSNRDATTTVNKAMRKIFSMARVEEKYVVINAPDWNFLDKDIKKLADVWISMTAKGMGLVHEVKPHPYLNKILTPRVGFIEVEDVATGTQLRKVYNYLTREKRAKISGEDGTQYITETEAEERVEKAVSKAERKKRNEILYAAYQSPKIEASQSALAEVVGLTQPTVSDIFDNMGDSDASA